MYALLLHTFYINNCILNEVKSSVQNIIIKKSWTGALFITKKMFPYVQ